MSSLTHVCMWSDKGWKRITAYEAAELHSRGTVSAKSGLFMCELCGQYVLLTDGYVQSRHFRHSSAEKSKDCPERTFNSGFSYYNSFLDEHELPLKINLCSDGYLFELGFIQVPKDLLSIDLKITIKHSDKSIKPFTFLRERLNLNGVSYLPVGNIPSENYKLTIAGTDNNIYKYWPKEIQGIDPDGSIFDVDTGKKLVYDSDVIVGKKYYLLKKGSVYPRTQHISIRQVQSVRYSWAYWNLYEVSASDYDKESAKFFLDYHCRLTEEPVAIQPVWPVYIESPYVIKHNQKNIYIYIQGNAPNTKVFPFTSKKEYPCGNGILEEIQCNSRQQLISAGRTNILQYTYFWQEPLKKTTPLPHATVVDLKNEKQETGIIHALPKNHILQIQTEYDGSVLIKKNGNLVEKRSLNASVPIEIDNIYWGTEIQVIVGKDNVWSAIYEKAKQTSAEDEEIIYKRLTSYSGRKIKISHEIGSIARKLVDYPAIRQWLYKCIRDGYVNERAFRDFQKWILSRTNDKGENR